MVQHALNGWSVDIELVDPKGRVREHVHVLNNPHGILLVLVLLVALVING